MKKFITFLWENKKWGILVLYILLSFVVFHTRATILYCYIPILRTTLLGDLPLDLLLLCLIFLGLVTCFEQLRRPWYISRKVDRTLHRWKIKTPSGEYPTLKRVYKSSYKKHELILELDGKGMGLLDMDKHLDHWRAGLNGKIRLDYGKKDTALLVYLLPRRYVKPLHISLESTQLCREPNMLVVGKTGSGKSYALTVILGIYAYFDPSVTIVICDYKLSSFAQFADSPSFYGYEKVPQGIRAVYKEFQERLAANDTKRNEKTIVLLVDEYGALISAQDRGEREVLKTEIANMLFMGRSLGIRVLLGVQRADSEHFKAGARDQFRTILAMGNISKEQKAMLFDSYKDSMNDTNKLGEGYLLIDGEDLERVIVDPIKDMNTLNAAIRKAMNH